MHDYVLFWNAVALELNRLDHSGKLNARNNRGPTRSSRALAIAHLAMHDAFFGRTGSPNYAGTGVAGLAGTITPYINLAPHAPIPAFGVASEGAAVSGAASESLRVLYPDFQHIIDDALLAFDFPLDPVTMRNADFDFGVRVGKAHVAARDNDGSGDGGPVPELPAYWRHREDPTEIGQGFLGQRWGKVKLFSAAAIPQMAAHPPLRSAAYNRAHNEVRMKGSANLGERGTPGANPAFGPRTPLQTLIGLYWAYDGASQIGTPPRLYNQIVRKILTRKVNGPFRTAASARLLALVNVAMADAGVAAWYYKYVYQLWRPILGIREYDSAFWHGEHCQSYHLHPLADPFWTPYGAPRTNEPGKKSFTPPFPAYPSGHATFGAASFEITRRFFGFAANQNDDLCFSFISDELNGSSIDQDGGYRSRQNKVYPSLLHAMFDNAISRVYLGVHWKFDGLDNDIESPEQILTSNSKVGGVPLGRDIAESIFSRKMAPSNVAKDKVEPVQVTKPACPVVLPKSDCAKP